MTAHLSVFAQQYSSAMLFSLRFHSLEEKSGSRLEKDYYLNLLLFKIAQLKFA
jgi:hypothetical protein